MPSSKKSEIKKTAATKSKPAKKPAASAAKKVGAILEGKKAPAFQLADANGKTVALKDLIGANHLVLYFYPKDMTPGCTIEACSFRDNNDRLTALGAQVVGISADSSASHTKFTEKHGLNFPLLADHDNKVTGLYGVYKMKSLYGRQFMGIDPTTSAIATPRVGRPI